MVLPQVSKSENLREVGNKIRYYREKKKMSQLERKRPIRGCIEISGCCM